MGFNVLTQQGNYTFHNYHNSGNKTLKGIFKKLANFFWSSVLLLSSTFPDGFAMNLCKRGFMQQLGYPGGERKGTIPKNISARDPGTSTESD